MPDTIDATVAGPSANSYVTLAFSDAYFADTLEARQWFGFNREDRIRALLSATDRIEFDMRCFRFSGKSRWEQALTFPTEFDLDSEGNLCIPDCVQYATCELALSVLRGTAIEDQLPRRVRKLLRPFLPAGGEQVPDVITSEELVGLSGEAAREEACTVCVDALQRAAHTIRELQKRVEETARRAGEILVKANEVEKRLQWAKYTEPLERWVATSIDFEGQDDTGYGHAWPTGDGDQGWTAKVTLYEEDRELTGQGAGSDLSDAMTDAIRVARGGEPSDA